jgi:glycosyltransferase EpsD
MVQKLNIENYVQFLGVRTDVAALLESSDIFISCSLAEAQGIAVLEAMSYQLPVVVSNVPGHIDYIVSGENGLLFNLNDPNACVGLISQIISDPEYADLLSMNARNTVINNFSMNNMINSINNIYSSFSRKK